MTELVRVVEKVRGEKVLLHEGEEDKFRNVADLFEEIATNKNIQEILEIVDVDEGRLASETREYGGYYPSFLQDWGTKKSGDTPREIFVRRKPTHATDVVVGDIKVLCQTSRFALTKRPAGGMSQARLADLDPDLVKKKFLFFKFSSNDSQNAETEACNFFRAIQLACGQYLASLEQDLSDFQLLLKTGRGTYIMGLDVNDEEVAFTRHFFWTSSETTDTSRSAESEGGFEIDSFCSFRGTSPEQEDIEKLNRLEEDVNDGFKSRDARKKRMKQGLYGMLSTRLTFARAFLWNMHSKSLTHEPRNLKLVSTRSTNSYDIALHAYKVRSEVSFDDALEKHVLIIEQLREKLASEEPVVEKEDVSLETVEDQETMSEMSFDERVFRKRKQEVQLVKEEPSEDEDEQEQGDGAVETDKGEQEQRDDAAKTDDDWVRTLEKHQEETDTFEEEVKTMLGMSYEEREAAWAERASHFAAENVRRHQKALEKKEGQERRESS